MNAIFVTQGLSLDLFHDLLPMVKSDLGIESAAFYVADSSHYRQFIETHPAFERENTVLKEWEIMGSAAGAQLDEAFLRNFEKNAGDPSLWSALLCDRRIMNGPFCKVTQDYKPRFSHDRMILILQEAAKAIENLFDTLRPGLVAAFVPVTFGDYLFYLTAKMRGVKYLQLKSTKIRNFVTFSDNIHERPSHIYETFRSYEESGAEPGIMSEAVRYIRAAQEKQVTYEGTVLKSAAPSVLQQRLNAVKLLPVSLKAEIAYRLGPDKDDNHVPPPFGTFWRRQFITPRRAEAMRRITAPRTVAIQNIQNSQFVFFPLHSEPEIALSIYGRPYANQIELIRNIAMSLPVNMRLIVKEHPRSLGFRSENYYCKLMEIPNVFFAPVDAAPRDIVLASSAVAVISGFIGLEALMLKKPVVTFGECPFNILEGSMLKKADNLWEIGSVINRLIEEYEYDEKKIACYIAATMARSVAVDLYSVLLGKSGRHQVGAESRDTQLKRLAAHFAARVSEQAD